MFNFACFQIGHLFIHGPRTKELMILVDTCETINESMIQLIFQTVVVLTTMHNEPITTIQKLVLVNSLFMASKGPAEAFLASKMKRSWKRMDVEEKEDGKNKSDIHQEPANKSGINTDSEVGLLDNTSTKGDDKHKNKTVKGAGCMKTDAKCYHEMNICQKLPLLGQFHLLVPTGALDML